jgi:DNA polymerase III delta subunit
MVVVGTKRPGPFVVAYGEEEFFLDRIITTGRSWRDRQVILLDGEGLADYEVVSFCEQGSFDDRKKAVILDNANKVKGDKALTAYVEAKDVADEGVMLVAVVRSEKLPKVWQTAAAKGRLEYFKKLRPWETPALKERISAEGKRLKLKLDDAMLDLCVLFFGDNLRRIVNELQKLTFIAQNGQVTKADFVSVAAPDIELDPFEVAKIATNKEAKKALRLVSSLFKINGDSVAVPITAGLVSQVERLIVTRQLLDSGVEQKTIAEMLGIPLYPVQKDIIPRAKKHTVPELLLQMKNLCRLDAKVKGAARSKRTLVELAVLAIAA